MLTAAAPRLGLRPHRREFAELDREPEQPRPGEAARGHGLEGTISALRRRQPLARYGIWRVSLAGEEVGRLVGQGEDGVWHLLQTDDLTDFQLETYDAAMEDDPSAAVAGPGRARGSGAR